MCVSSLMFFCMEMIIIFPMIDHKNLMGTGPICDLVDVNSRLNFVRVNQSQLERISSTGYQCCHEYSLAFTHNYILTELIFWMCVYSQFLFFLKKVIVISHKLEYSMLKYKTVCSVVNIMLLPAKDSLQGKKKNQAFRLIQRAE